MQKEIGSIFSVSKYETGSNEVSHENNEFLFFSLCREALLFAARNCGKDRKVILIPAYTCQTVLEPFLQEDWEVHFFPLDSKLCINEAVFLSLLESVSPSAVLFHPYYGKKLLEYEIDLLKRAKEQGAWIIQDLTQSIFSKRNPDYVDITVGSMRKWLGIPDGAFLSVSGDIPLDEIDAAPYNTAFTVPQLDAMYLRGEYFRTDNPNYKQISIRLNKHAEGLMEKEPITAHKMSDYSRGVLNNANLDQIRKKRFENFGTLLSLIKRNDVCRAVIGSMDELADAPLYFPVYVKERERFQKALAEKSIYAPVLWGIENKEVLVNDTVEYIYNHLLAIPVDQRYDYDDMQRIADVIYEICDLWEVRLIR